MTTLTKKYEEQFSRITERESTFVQLLRKAGKERLSEIQAIEQMVKDDLRVGIERDSLASVIRDLLARVEVAKRISNFAPDDPVLQEVASELERIRAWAEPTFARAAAPLKPFDGSKLPPPTEGPKPEGYTSLDEALDWMSQQPLQVGFVDEV